MKAETAAAVSTLPSPQPYNVEATSIVAKLFTN